jgi:ABC-type uncharacterized transport system ATPase subunit
MKRTTRLDYNTFANLVNDGDTIIWDNGDVAHVKKLNDSIVLERDGATVPFTIERGYTVEAYIFDEKRAYYHVVERENSSAFEILKNN